MEGSMNGSMEALWDQNSRQQLAPKAADIRNPFVEEEAKNDMVNRNKQNLKYNAMLKAYDEIVEHYGQSVAENHKLMEDNRKLFADNQMLEADNDELMADNDKMAQDNRQLVIDCEPYIFAPRNEISKSINDVQAFGKKRKILKNLKKSNKKKSNKKNKKKSNKKNKKK